MAVQWDTYPVEFVSGVDSKRDPKAVGAIGAQDGDKMIRAALLDLVNGHFQRPGAIAKRPKFTSVPVTVDNSSVPTVNSATAWQKPNTTAVGAGKGLFKLGNELLLLDGYRLRAKSTYGNWIDRGALVPMGVTSAGAAGGGMVMAAANDIAVSADAGKIWITEVSTGRVLRTDDVTATIGTNTPQAAVVLGQYLVLIFASPPVNSGHMYFYKVDSLSPSTVYVIQDQVINNSGCAAVAVSSTEGRLIFHNSTGDMRWAKFNTLGFVSGSTVITGAGAGSGFEAWVSAGTSKTSLGICKAANGDIYYFWYGAPAGNTHQILCSRYNSSDVQQFGPTKVFHNGSAGTYADTIVISRIIAVESSTANTIVLYYSHTNVTDTRCVLNCSVITSTGLIAGIDSIDKHANLRPISDIFVVGSQHYFVAQYVSAGTADGTVGWAFARIPGDDLVWQPTYVLMCGNFTSAGVITATSFELTIQGRFLESAASSTFQGGLSSGATIVKSGASKYIVQLMDTNGSAQQIVMDFSAPVQAAVIGDSLFISSGLIFEYDGREVVEAGFHIGPDDLQAVGIVGTMPAGDVYFQAIYTWTNRHGRVYRSGVSQLYKATVNGSQGLRVSVPDLWITNRNMKSCSIELYLSDAANSSVLRLAATVATGATAQGSHKTIDVTTLPSGINRLLYTTGGVVDHRAPGACSSVITRGSRLFGAGTDGKVYFTKELADREGAALFGDELVKALPDGLHGAYFLAQIDSSIVALTQLGLSAFNGAGPSDTALGDGYTDFQEIASGIPGYDPSDANKIAAPLSCDFGVFFWSRGAPRLLSRNLALEQSFGLEIENIYVPDYLKAIALKAKQKQVWFFGKSNVNNSDLAFVFDYLVRQWSVYILQSSTVPTGAVEISGALYYQTATGAVLQEQTTFDANDPLSLRTGWIKPNNYMGEFRNRRIGLLGEKKAACDLIVEVMYDYDDTVVETFTLNTGTAWTAGKGEFASFRTARQRCTAISVRIRSANSSGTNEDFTINGLTLELGLRKNQILRTLPSTKAQ